MTPRILLVVLGVVLAVPRAGAAQAIVPLADVTAAAAGAEGAAAYFQLSQTHAAANDPAAAFAAIERALALRPGHAAYLRAKAIYATWLGDYATAKRCYEQLETQQRGTLDVPLEFARVSAWTGDTDEAVSAYRHYLERDPGSPEVWLELARAESWRGNAPGAVEALRGYRDRFGESAEYAVALARVLATGGRPGRALHLLDPLYRQDPDSYEVNLARAIALAMRNQIGGAHDSLASVRRIDPTGRETRSAERLVRAAIGSRVEPRAGFYTDSDNLEVSRLSPFASVALHSGTQLSGGYDRWVLRAPQTSGLARANGGSATFESVWAGAAQTVGPLTLSGRIGASSVETRDLTSYVLGAKLRASDAVSAAYEHGREFFVVSPRTLELGLTQRRHHVDVVVTPTLSATVTGTVIYQKLSDGNARWEYSVTPRHGVARTRWVNLDLGASVYRLGTREDLPNGYYDPRQYESYNAVAFPYFKISEHTGLGASLALGVQREGRASFRPGGSAAAEATIGIYRPWLLRISAGVTRNQRLESGAFRGYIGDIAISRRF